MKLYNISSDVDCTFLLYEIDIAKIIGNNNFEIAVWVDLAFSVLNPSEYFA